MLWTDHVNSNTGFHTLFQVQWSVGRQQAAKEPVANRRLAPQATCCRLVGAMVAPLWMVVVQRTV